MAAQPTVDVLNDQIRAELDMVQVVRRALDGCRQMDVREGLAGACEEHARHADELARLVRARGAEPADRRDFAGYWLAASTRVASRYRHEPGAMRAVRRAEERTTGRYEAALYDDLPDDVRQAFERILGEERARMAWMDGTIRARGWQEVPAPWPIP
jgi:hypothetical protein